MSVTVRRHHIPAFAAAILAAGAMAQEENKPLRLIAEAEDFRVARPGWSVLPYRENYFSSTFGITFLSRMAALSAPAQMPAGESAVAEQEVEIAHDGQFDVLARYEQPYDFAAEFTVEILQNGKTVYSEVFGRLADTKIWGCAGAPEARRAPMQRFPWGATDNVVWQEKGSVALTRGAATLRLIAAAQMEGGQPRLQAARRNVDLVCLTDDRAGREAQRAHYTSSTYLEMDGWLVKDGDIFVRVRNMGDKPLAPLLAPHPQGEHSPWFGAHLRDWPSVKILKDGYAQTETAFAMAGPRSAAVPAKKLAARLDPALFKNAVEDQFLPPRARSGWVPLGQMIDAMHDSIWLFKNSGRVELEFAVPDGNGGLKSIKKTEADGDIAFEIAGNLAPNAQLARILRERYWTPEIVTVEEALQWLKEAIAKFPQRPETAKRFMIYGIMGFGDGLKYPAAREIALALGDNTAVGQEGKKRGIIYNYATRDAAKMKAAMAEGFFDDTLVVSYGDEIHLPARQPDDDAFRDWLRARGVPGADSATYTTDRDNPFFYYSRLCAVESGARPFVEMTAALGEKGVLAGANYSPHGNYLVDEVHYIRPFKQQAMTLPWSEDYVWQVPEFSVQVSGYLVSAFRAAAKYHDTPILMYVMPHSPGNTAADFRRSFYTSVAHGARIIHYFCGSPLAVGATENYVATRDLAMWRAIYDCTRGAGLFEDYVVDGRVRPAKVGLLLSSVEDILSGVHNMSLALHNNERKAIYYALRHAQVPVDFLSEDDIIDGLAADYRVIYVTQRWLHSRAVTALAAWVEKGGTLVALCGGGFRNEFDRDNPDANALYGVREQQIASDPDLLKYIETADKTFLSKQDLPRYKPFDAASWGEGEKRVENVGVIGWKQRLVASDARVAGTFRDGAPAVLEKAHGQGRAVLFAFLPGQEYLRSALPLRPVDRQGNDQGYNHFIPTAMNTALRRALVDDLLPSDFVKPVLCSETLVETTCIDTARPARRLAVPLVNYSAGPVASLEVAISGIDAIRAVRSVERKNVTHRIDNNRLIVQLPLDVADMLLIDL